MDISRIVEYIGIADMGHCGPLPLNVLERVIGLVNDAMQKKGRRPQGSKGSKKNVHYRGLYR